MPGRMSNALIRRHRLSAIWPFILAGIGVLILIHLISPLPAAGQPSVNENETEETLKNPKIPWNLEADEVYYDAFIFV